MKCKICDEEFEGDAIVISTGSKKCEECGHVAAVTKEIPLCDVHREAFRQQGVAVLAGAL